MAKNKSKEQIGNENAMQLSNDLEMLKKRNFKKELKKWDKEFILLFDKFIKSRDITYMKIIRFRLLALSALCGIDYNITGSLCDARINHLTSQD